MQLLKDHFSLPNALFTVAVMWITAAICIKIVKRHMDDAFGAWARHYPGVGKAFLDEAFGRLEAKIDRLEERFREHLVGHR